METYPPIYIGPALTIAALRNYIIDTALVEDQLVLMHPSDYDELALEYRETYNEHLPAPYMLLSVEIGASEKIWVPPGRVRVVEQNRSPHVTKQDYLSNSSPEEVYRCGYCGNVVDYDGAQLDTGVRQRKIYAIQTNDAVVVTEVHGYCCPQES